MHVRYFFCSAACCFHNFAKMCSPPSVGSTFLKTSFEQSAFKNPFFGALNARNEGSVGHIFCIYRSSARSVRLCSASVAHRNFNFRLEKCVFLLLEPDQQNDNKYHTCEFMIVSNLVANLHQKCNMQDAFLIHLFALMHFVFICLQKCAPRGCQKHIFENQP